MVTRIIISLLGIFFFSTGVSFSQDSQKLKDLLWRNDIKKMISNMGEEHVVLREEGKARRRLRARSFNEIKGFRIQVFAGSGAAAARALAAQIQDLQLDSVYLAKEKNLFKVQLGNYRDRRKAEIMLDRLRYKGFSNAWIVDAIIHEPKPPAEQKVTQGTVTEMPRFIYAIQLFVTRDSEKSQIIKKNLIGKLPQEIWILRQDAFWKILAGKFKEKQKAQKALVAIKTAGFPDAWITQVNF